MHNHSLRRAHHTVAILNGGAIITWFSEMQRSPACTYVAKANETFAVLAQKKNDAGGRLLFRLLQLKTIKIAMQKS